jgi:hypothetical protein
MPAFAVLEPPGPAGAAGHPDRFIFLHEKFSLGAFLFGPLWLIAHGLWLELVAYLTGLALAGSILYAIGVGGPGILLIFSLLQLLLGLEATSLMRWRRIRSGWRDGGVVIADDLDLAERRFFEDRVAHRTADRAAADATPAPVASTPAPPPLPGPPAGTRGVTGLFPERGGGR